MKNFFKFLNAITDYFSDYIHYYKDIYKLITLKDKFVLGELTDRAFNSPNGIVTFDVKILGIRLASVVAATGEKYVQAVASYGNEHPNFPERYDPLAREPLAKVEKLIGIKSIVSQTDLHAQGERKPLKNAINAEHVLKFSAEALNEAFKKWDHKTSLNEQLSYVAMQMVSKVFINVHDIPKTLIPLIARAEDTLINFDQMSVLELEQIKKELQAYSRRLIEENHQKIMKDNPYVVRYLGSSEVEKLLEVNTAATLVVSGNVTALLVGAVLKLVQNKDIFHKIKQEADQLDLSDLNVIDLDKLKSLPYLNLFYKECLRYFSPNPPLVRYVSKKGKLADVDIYPRTHLFVPIRAIMHHSTFWENPEKFNPERFLNNKKTQGVFPFIPFSTGSRMCPASVDFVQVLVKMATVLLTKNYDCTVELPCEEIEIATKQPRLKQPYFMTLKPRLSKTPEQIIFSKVQSNTQKQNQTQLDINFELKTNNIKPSFTKPSMM